jgi:hypothetical protein
MTKIIVSIVQNIAVGSIDYEDGIEHLKHLIPQLKDTEDIGHSGYFIFQRPIESFKTMTKVSNFLTREIVGKRRSNYCGFFKHFVKHLVHSISITVPYTNELEEKLDFLKDYLRWRFAVPCGDWRNEIQNKGTKKICIVDETISNILYPEGLKITPVVLSMTMMTLNAYCSLRFRKACEKLLFHGKYGALKGEGINLAKKACMRKLKE